MHLYVSHLHLHDRLGDLGGFLEAMTPCLKLPKFHSFRGSMRERRDEGGNWSGDIWGEAEITGHILGYLYVCTYMIYIYIYTYIQYTYNVCIYTMYTSIQGVYIYIYIGLYIYIYTYTHDVCSS